MHRKRYYVCLYVYVYVYMYAYIYEGTWNIMCIDYSDLTILIFVWIKRSL